MTTGTRTLHILHTSDLHGQVEAMPYLATVVRQTRQERPDALLLDAGDWAHGSRISDAFQGKPMVEIMNELRYDAIGVGEGDLHWGLEALQERASEARFPILSANLRTPQSTPPEGILDRVLITKDGLPIGIFGLSCPQCETPQTRIADPIATARAQATALKHEGAEVIIVLSHLGLEQDRVLAFAVPGLHCIVGGHQHLDPSPPERIGNAVLAHAGHSARHLGVMAIELESREESRQ